MSNTITSEAELDEIYGQPVAVAVTKEINHISAHYRAFIEKSPFVVIASSGPEGLDCTPRGDPAGFVRVLDQNTVLIPDRRGNNRIDTLRNIVRDPRISLLFLIPGIGQTLRINGQAEIRTDPELRESFTMQDKVPATVIAVTAERIYTQCPKALVRSKLWDTETQIPRSALPSSGEIL
jgi:PPOX class probable FMN-dependent enzyme